MFLICDAILISAYIGHISNENKKKKIGSDCTTDWSQIKSKHKRYKRLHLMVHYYCFASIEIVFEIVIIWRILSSSTTKTIAMKKSKIVKRKRKALTYNHIRCSFNSIQFDWEQLYDAALAGYEYVCKAKNTTKKKKKLLLIYYPINPICIECLHIVCRSH